jgi:hypothetical protein
MVDVFYGSVISIAVAMLFTVIVPRMYPWGEEHNG